MPGVYILTRWMVEMQAPYWWKGQSKCTTCCVRHNIPHLCSFFSPIVSGDSKKLWPPSLTGCLPYPIEGTCTSTPKNFSLYPMWCQVLHESTRSSSWLWQRKEKKKCALSYVKSIRINSWHLNCCQQRETNASRPHLQSWMLDPFLDSFGS